MYSEKNEITSFCNSTVNINEIPCIFRDYFLNDFNKLKPVERGVISEALPYLYKMWYFSTLVDGLPLSPSDYINSQVKEKYGDETRVVPIVTPIYKYKVLKDLKFNFKLFNIERHPVLCDLKLFLDNCSPDIGMTERGLPVDEEVNSILNQLTFKETFYVTFLTNIAFELKLLKDLPSINTYRAVPMKGNMEDFFKLSNTEQLKMISRAVISMASKIINQVLSLDSKAFSEQTLTKLFGNACDLDDHIGRIFEELNLGLNNIDFEQLLLTAFNDEESLDMSNDTLDAMTLMIELSFLFDAYLLTPLGYYLQLIQPIYNEEMNFPFHFDQLLDAHKSDLPLMKFYFSMSNGFDLTDLGSKIMLDVKRPKSNKSK